MPLVGLWGTLCCMLLTMTAIAQNEFVTTWQTTTANESVTIPVNPTVTGYNYNVNWGDGSTVAGQTGDAEHTYATPGTYTVSISGDFPAIQLWQFGNEVSDKLMSIEHWGNIEWKSMEGAFSGARYMVLNASDVPNLSGVSSMAQMFSGAELVNGDFGGWNVSSVTDMSKMFNGAAAFNGNISGWNVSNVTDMSWMFWGASAFNQDIGGWEVGNVEDMSFMFYQAPVFNQDLSSWDVSRVTTMNSMFFIALNFDQSLGSWDISNVTDMGDMLLATGLSSANYGATLVGWAALPSVPSNITLNAAGQEYCPGSAAETARQELEMKGWHIIGDNPATDCGGGTDEAFITTWRTTAADESITIRINPSVTGYNYTVDWGDGNTSTGQTGNATHAYSTAGTYEVSISGSFPALYEAGQQLISVEQWGDMIWQSMERAFMDAANLVIRASDTPDLTHVTSMERAFEGTTYFSSDLSNWDVSSVENMNLMFFRATAFNGDLSGWDVSSVKNMANMFEDAASFNGDLNDWDVSSVENMHGMFMRATAFNGDIRAWVPSRVTNMANMFEDATSFTGNLSGWDVSSVENMQGMFMRATAFNGDLSGWVPSRVTNMANMFEEAESFAGNLSGWDVSSVENMQGMFMGAATFNSDLSAWVTSQVTNMTTMFERAASFNQDLGGWDVSSVENMTNMLNRSGLSPEYYDATLIGWATQAVQPDVMLGAQGLTFCAGADARQQLIDDHQWSIDDAGEASDCGGGGIGPADPSHFITIWKTDNDGPSGDDQITIPASGEFTYTWVDTNNPASTGSGSGNGGTTITFPQAGTYEVRIAPTGSSPFNRIYFAAFVSGDKLKLLEIKNWGAIHWGEFAFGGCTNLSVTATDIPDLSGLTDLSFAFSYSGIDEIPNFNDWDVSNVTNMGNLFEQATNFNQPLDKWDVSNVTDMRFMFDGATSFNQPLDSWDVRKLEHFDYMFRDASSFNQSLGTWKLESLRGAVAAFFRSGMSCENFSYTLFGWATHPNTNEGVIFGPNEITFSPDVAPYRDFLINDLDWNFQGNDGVGTCSVTLPSTPVTPGPGNILYVDQNVPDGSGSGDSWENAIPELADALKWAREQHDGGSPGWDDTDPLKIFVAKGVYKPLYNAADGAYTTDGGRDNSFVLVPDVQLYGGFDPPAGIETLEDPRILPNMNNLEQGSILSGDFNGNDNTANYDNHTENAHHVTIASGNVGSALMDGFTVTGGYATGNTSGPSVMGQTVYRFFGGGTYIISSSPQFTHMAWFNNLGEWGGGLYNSVSLLTEISSPALSNVTFYRNMAPGGGGGIRNFGGSVDIKQAIFAHNGAGLVEDGTSSGPGGGIYSSGNGTSLSITNATFSGNWIVGAFIPSFDGAAIQVEQTSTWLNNVVIWGNEVEGDPADPSASISISLGGDVIVANSLVAHSGGSANWNNAMGILDGGNNIDADPAFVSSTPGEAGFLQLNACSPAISIGNNSAYTDAGGNLAADLDLAGNPRVYNQASGGVIDMGAYEYQGERVYIEQLAAPAAVTVAYGTAWDDIDGLPTAVTAGLSDDTDVSIPLDGNRDHWTLLTPAGSSYDGDVAGTYVFSVPLLIPAEACYLNPEDLRAEVTVAVEKGTPILAASWNGEAVDAVEGLSLTYGDVGGLTFSTTDPDGVVTYTLGIGDDAIVDLSDLDAVAAHLAGNATLTIEQEETDNYEAVSLSLAVTVAQKAITIIPTADQGKVYGADDPDTYAYGLADGDMLAFDDALTDIVSATTRQEGEGVGAYDIELAVDGEQAVNYAISFEADNDAFVIMPLEITVTVENKTKVFGMDDPALTYMYAPELIADDEFTGGLEREEGDNVGNYVITRGNLSLDDNYVLVFEAGALTITPLETTVVADDKTKVFGTDDPALTYTFMPELIGDDAFAGGLDRAEGDDVGSYAITQGDLSLSDNYEITFEEGTLTIMPAAYEGITFNDGSFEYDGTEHVLELNGELPEEVTVSYSIDSEPGNGATDVGTYEVKAFIDGGNNYEDAELTATLIVTPLEITVVADDKTKVFGTDDPALTYTFMPELIGDDTFAGGLDRAEGEDVGSYAITQGDLSLGDNYEITFEEGTLTITPAVYEGIAFNDGSFEYDGTEHVLGLTGELPEGVTVSYSIDGEPGNGATDAGTYEVTATIDGGDNYEDAELTATLIVTPKEITVVADDKTKVFGVDDPALTYTFMPELIGDDAFAGGLDRAEGDDVGSYAITQGGLSLGDNYEISFEEGTLTITPAAYEGITFSDGSFEYDGTEHVLELSGALPAGAVTYTIDGKASNGATDAGTYEVIATIDGGENYENTELMATLTITPAEITGIALNSTSSTYDGTEHRLSLAGNLPAGASVAYENNGRTNVGSQTVKAIVDGGGNYQNKVLEATLTILAAERTLHFEALPEKTYGDAAFDAVATASSGEAISYTSSDPDVAEVTAGGKITITGAGETIIKATVPEHANYANRPQASRILTVRKASQTITLDGPTEVSRDAGSIGLTASSTSGLPVVLTADNAEVATLEGTTLNILRLGRVTISATQAGDANHEAAEPVALTIRVIDPTSDLPVRVHPVISPNGDGINEFLMIEAVTDYPENMVTIFNRNGTLLWEASGYDNNRVAFRGISTGQQLLPAGTYFYIVEVKDGNTWKHKKGYFVLRY